MANEFWIPLTTALGIVGFFGGIALLKWIEDRGNAREKELAHIERLKALELGQTLPNAEVARLKAIGSRAWAVGLTTLFVPLGMAGAAVGATALTFQRAEPGIHLPLMCVVWGICGLVGLIAVCLGLAALRHKELARPLESRPLLAATKHQPIEAIRAADTPVLPPG